MFTGIVETQGKIKAATMKDGGLWLVIEEPQIVKTIKVGSSVAVNGVCLTVEKIKRNEFEVSVVPETLSHSNLGELKVSQKVNLEKAAVFGGPIDGHLLTGHVDCTGMITSIDIKGNSQVYTISFPQDFAKYLVSKGSVGIDGISLTVAELRPDAFTVSIIPHTLERTTLKVKTIGQKVNLEFDILAKYMERHFEASMPKNGEFVLEELMGDIPDQNFMLN
ncbi:MAG: riboflavin synthase [Candidatus Saganbacteria bacterium]|nr:riboflavin synthase [Candidatus Saganbacteria bacterium]